MTGPTGTEPKADQGRACSVDVVLFDFGGVLAEEGFRNGLRTIARKSGRDPDDVSRMGFELVYDTGYVLGKSSEAEFWRALRERTGIRDGDSVLRDIILSHFILRPSMLAVARELRERGVSPGILSDQCNWLDELEGRYRFFGEFDHVFNSYHLGRGKREAGLFDEVVRRIGVTPDRALFIDDNPGNVDRARGRGLKGILFVDEEQFRRELGVYCPGMERAGRHFTREAPPGSSP